MPPLGEREGKYRALAIAGLVLLVVGLIAGGLAQSFDHDESQFIAAGTLLARERLLPYLDYPYFHLPNLVFVYAALFSTNDFLLLSARSFNIVCAILLLTLTFRMALGRFDFLGEKRWLLAAAITALLALNPFFRITTGRAWNHDLPMLASVAACAVLLRGAEGKGGAKAVAVAGMLFGLAIGTRVSFLPLILPFAILAYLYSPPAMARTRSLCIFGGALVFALLPTILLVASAPATFWFDNMTLNGTLSYRHRHAEEPGEWLVVAKFAAPLKLLARRPSSLLLVIAFLIFAWRLPSRRGWSYPFRSAQSAAFLLLVPFALLGALLPYRAHYQYYGFIIPFLVLGTAAGMAEAWKAGRATLVLRFLTLLILLSLAEIAFELPRSGLTKPLEKWRVFAAHDTGTQIRSVVGAGRVLTLIPLYPLEGGLSIYKEFCASPFAFRFAAFADPEDRERFHLVSSETLPGYLQEKPAAILTDVGESKQLERPLIEYAENNGYRKIKLRHGRSLWLPPGREVR